MKTGKLDQQSDQRNGPNQFDLFRSRAKPESIRKNSKWGPRPFRPNHFPGRGGGHWNKRRKPVQEYR